MAICMDESLITNPCMSPLQSAVVKFSIIWKDQQETSNIQHPASMLPVSVPCGPGHYAIQALSKCQPCPRGSYREDDEAINCSTCPPGTSTRTVGTERRDECLRETITTLVVTVSVVVNFIHRTTFLVSSHWLLDRRHFTVLIYVTKILIIYTYIMNKVNTFHY